MPAKLKNLTDDSTLVILAYADAGLGHLRVTNALYEGLPEDARPVLLRSKEGAIRAIHRFTSSSPLLRDVLLWTQKGKQEEMLTSIYVNLLQKGGDDLLRQLEDIVEQQMHIAQKVVVVCTHFGLAHQFGKIKADFEKKWKIKLFLAVCVTDDSPQPIWYVPEANLITVPSEETGKRLEKYRRRKKLPKTEVIAIPYPISPLLGEELKLAEFAHKKRQLNPLKTDLINVSVPISGAAVGLEYLDSLMKILHRKNGRFVFNIVSQKSILTQYFLDKTNRRNYATVMASSHSRKVVRLYDKMFLNSILSLEITKPSEQAFKVLFSPRQKGGVIMLFTEPVGEQEYDNLDYLVRNGLIPNDTEQEKLWLYSKERASFSETTREHLVYKARQWRGLRIPSKPTEAANFIVWCLEQEIFRGMMSSMKQNSKGVEEFWKLVDKSIFQSV